MLTKITTFILLWLFFCLIVSILTLTPLTTNVLFAIASLLLYVILSFLFLFYIGAEFFSLLFLSVYGGAIVVLFSFAAMFVGPSGLYMAPDRGIYEGLDSLLFSFLIVKFSLIKNFKIFSFFFRLKTQVFPINPVEGGSFNGKEDIDAIAELLYSDTIVLFIFTGVLFFLVLVGVVLLCSKTK